MCSVNQPRRSGRADVVARAALRVRTVRVSSLWCFAFSSEMCRELRVDGDPARTAKQPPGHERPDPTICAHQVELSNSTQPANTSTAVDLEEAIRARQLIACSNHSFQQGTASHWLQRPICALKNHPGARACACACPRARICGRVLPVCAPSPAGRRASPC